MKKLGIGCLVLLIIAVVGLVLICVIKTPAPPFSLEGVAEIKLPPYKITNSYVGDEGQNVYNLEWLSPMTQQDSVELRSSISDFYEHYDGQYFKCYADGDSSICLYFKPNGVAITKEETHVFKPLIDELKEKTGAKIPDDVKPLFYYAWYGFNDCSYETAVERSLIPDSSMAAIIKWEEDAARRDTLSFREGLSVREDTINGVPVLFIGHFDY